MVITPILLSPCRMILFFAACSTRSTFSRRSWTIFAAPLPAWLAARIFRRTIVPFLPRMSFTTTFILHPMTSTNSAFFPCPTPKILSPFFKRLLLNAGPPGITSLTTVYSLSVWSRAPIPSRERLMSIWKFLYSSGEK